MLALFQPSSTRLGCTFVDQSYTYVIDVLFLQYRHLCVVLNFDNNLRRICSHGLSVCIATHNSDKSASGIAFLQGSLDIAGHTNHHDKWFV